MCIRDRYSVLERLFLDATLASSDLRVATKAADQLRWAVMDDPKAKEEVREAGAFPLLSRLLVAETTDDDAVRAACAAIYTLCQGCNHRCQEAGGAVGLVAQLVALLGGGAGPLHEQTQIDVCTALGLLCVGHAANQAAAHRHGAVDVLVALAAYGRFDEPRPVSYTHLTLPTICSV